MAAPHWLPKRHRYKWRHPWKFRARHSPGFKRILREHGYLSPHFTKAEAACKDGTPVPASLIGNAQRHAFRLERLRHKLGDVAMSALSWYRHPAYNRAIGGASQSRHIQADATDFSTQWVNSVGRAKVLAVGNRVFRKNGMGTYPSGSVHFDSRPWYARWTSF